MSQDTPPIQDRIIRLPQVKDLTGLGRSSIYLGIKEGRFPRHINLGGRSVGWLESEIRQWIADRVNASRPITAKE
jgi:prophage regulatory protein